MTVQIEENVGCRRFGNFNYGAVGAAYGFTLQALLNQAGNVLSLMDAFMLQGISSGDRLENVPEITAGFNYFQMDVSEVK